MRCTMINLKFVKIHIKYKTVLHISLFYLLITHKNTHKFKRWRGTMGTFMNEKKPKNNKKVNSCAAHTKANLSQAVNDQRVNYQDREYAALKRQNSQITFLCNQNYDFWKLFHKVNSLKNSFFTAHLTLNMRVNYEKFFLQHGMKISLRPLVHCILQMVAWIPQV